MIIIIAAVFGYYYSCLMNDCGLIEKIVNK
jgi:hypothetical protein